MLISRTWNINFLEMMKMDWAQVLTVVGSVIAIIGSNIAMILWARSEASSDHRLMLGIIDGIRQEMKDFHGRLCAIEESKKHK